MSPVADVDFFRNNVKPIDQIKHNLTSFPKIASFP